MCNLYHSNVARLHQKDNRPETMAGDNHWGRPVQIYARKEHNKHHPYSMINNGQTPREAEETSPSGLVFITKAIYSLP